MNELDINKFKSCTCGTSVNDTDRIDLNYKYTWIGWFFWSMGTTAIPTQITFNCRKCNNKFEDLTDSELIKYYIFFKRH